MSSSIKRIERKQELAKRKTARKSMRIMERVLNSMPNQCTQCSREFDPKIPGALDTWRATVSSTGMTIMCPLCAASLSVQQNKV